MWVTGSFRISDGAAAPRGHANTVRLGWARGFAVWRFEVRAQRREPLTVLYALVFGLLSLGFASSDAVELVSNRGAVPRTADWSLLLAFGGLTAFGQVITTMIATTAMLRDEAQRTRALIATSGLGPRTWFLARVVAALAVMLLVYAAMPAGMVVGTLISGGDVSAALTGSARAFFVITAPTMLVVTVLLSVAALLTQRVLGVLAMALALVGLWQLALALGPSSAPHEASSLPMTATVAALLDPFGNVPVLVVTRAWSAAQRSTELVPLTGLVMANRLLWTVLASVIAALALVTRASRAFAPVSPRVPSATVAAVSRALSRATSALASARAFTASWMQYDGGWRVVSALAVLNAAGNASTRPFAAEGGTLEPFAAVLWLVSEHARLFLILLATVYAGELVWRERDVRVQQLVDALPVSRAALFSGRVQGLLLAQRRIVLPLALIALAIAAVRTGGGALARGDGWLAWLAWSVFVLWLPFAQLTLLSLAVHLLLDHKVLAHLLLITGWVVAVVLDGHGVSAWWVRFGDPPPLLTNGSVAWGPLVQRGAYWTAMSVALLMVPVLVRRGGARPGAG